MKQNLYGLVGFPLTHSFSKTYFEEKFRSEGLTGHSYQNFELKKIEDIKALLNRDELRGFNVTLPYKKLVIPYLQDLDETAKKVGAVNCVKRSGDFWKGYNTDILGFENSLKKLLKPHHTKALVLGTGGAAQAVSYVLENRGIPVTKVSRIDQEDAMLFIDLTREIIQDHKLIINTTPLGSFPDIDKAPLIPYEHIGSEHLCYDLNYNPPLTLFLERSFEYGAKIKNGYEMLVAQAEESWRLWTS